MPYRKIQDPATLRRVLQATLMLEGNLELPPLLRHLMEEAQSMTGARYCALGVLNEDRTALAEFITSGLTPEQEDIIGERPTGLGVLGLLISDPATLRLSHIDQHSESFGFPANHPPMTSFLGVPIKVRDEVYGNLYLTDKVGWSEFTNDDQALVEVLALAAGIAIENARLHARAQQAVVFEDRDRMARDLHDTVIQRLFAIGLSLQSMIGNEAGLESRLKAAVAEIDHTIQEIRTTIYELGSEDTSLDLRGKLLGLIREIEPSLGFHVEVSFEGPVDMAISSEIGDHLMAIVREALSNVGRHAHASSTRLTLSAEDDYCTLQVVDNGAGLGGTAKKGEGLGLSNLRRRAEKLHGELLLGNAEGGGTWLTWRVPLVPPTP